jgi:major membrane immunogen (membrane-anchored lipoprotein)
MIKAKARFSPVLIPCLLGIMLIPGACKDRRAFPRDGYYSAEAAAFDEHGWKEFVTIGVSNGRIGSVEYNAKNPSGFIKSWDMDYMRLMNAVSGTYPNEYTRFYGEQLLLKQDAEAVDTLSGATSSYHSFKELARRALENAKQGDTSVSLVSFEGLGAE